MGGIAYALTRNHATKTPKIAPTMLILRTNFIGGTLTAWRASDAFNFLAICSKRLWKQIVPPFSVDQPSLHSSHFSIACDPRR